MLLLPQRLRCLFGRPLRLGWFDHPTMHAYRPPKHPDSPERVAAVEAELRRQGIWPHLLQIQGKEATDSQIALGHSRSYLFRLEGMQPQTGKIRRIDDDTVLTDNALEAARIAAGTVIKAVDFVLAGKIRNAFCATRPPGHHAKSKQSGSFCLINHTAVAAMHAVSRHHLQRVAVLDFDVHRGDGSEEILHGQPNILLLGLSQNRLYPYDDHPLPQNGNCFNAALSERCGSREFRHTVRNEWLPRLRAFKPQLILLSAGFDAHRDDPLGDARLHEADYAWLTHKIMQTAPQCGGKIVSVLEGGYHPPSLAAAAAAHLYVLAGLGKPPYAVEYEQLLKQEEEKNQAV